MTDKTITVAKVSVDKESAMENEEDMVVYDVEQAAVEVAKRSDQELPIVEEILEAEFFFNAALGFYEIPDDEEGQQFMEEVRKIREQNEDLLPPADQEIEDYDEIEDKLVAFIHRITGAEEAVIEAVLDEHIIYLEEQGVLEPMDEE
jgi:hypothetical protein